MQRKKKNKTRNECRETQLQKKKKTRPGMNAEKEKNKTRNECRETQL
jgi:hypothetical protein